MTNSSGSETLLQTSVKGEKVLSPDTADVVCELLQANTNYGTTKAAAVSGFQTMAKTGTTTDEKDRWFAAGTPYYVSATWYGYDTPKTIYLDSNYNPSAKLFKAVLIRFTKIWRPKNLGKAASRLRRNIVRKPACWPRHPALLRRRDGIRLPIRRQCAPPAAVPVCSIILRTMFPMRLGRRGMSFLMPSIMQVRLWRMH